mgnify:CR=1 FL=1
MDGKLDNDYNGSANTGKGIKFGKNADGSFFTLRPYLPNNILQITKNDSTSLFSVDTSGNGTLGGKQIITSGNIGSQSVNYASSSNHANSADSANKTSNGDPIVGTMANSSFTGISRIAKYASSNTMNVTAGGVNYLIALTSGSDRRIKQDIHPSEVNAIDLLCSLQAYSYNFKYKQFGERQELGFVAQEMQSIIPNAVIASEQNPQDFDGLDTILTINYVEIVPYLIKAIQELSHEIEIIKTT